MALAACASSPPVTPWNGPDEALAQLQERAARVHTLRASARVILTRPDGDTVHLDSALAAAFPNRLRLRAWKMGHTVFDMTWNPTGLWIAVPDHEGPAPSDLSVPAAGLAQAWLLFSPEFFQRPQASVLTPDRGPSMFVQRTTPGGPTVICEVDRATLTPRRYTTLDSSGVPRAALILDRYRDVDGIVWPTRIQAHADQGDIAIAIDSAQFNTDLPDDIFVPPPDAAKQP
jgi:outer membrane lipoprotein-sorting protein